MKYILKKNTSLNFKLTVLILFITPMSLSFSAEHIESPSFCGGMLYQVGWNKITTDQGDVSGLSTGLGGKLTFYITPGLRLGAMGFSNNLRFDTSLHTPSSYINLGAGGATVEMVWNHKNFRIVPGLMLGGGSLEYLHIISVVGEEKTVIYNSYASFLIAPLFSVEVPITKKISAALMTDWIFGTSVISGNNYGPSIRLGILFTH